MLVLSGWMTLDLQILVIEDDFGKYHVNSQTRDTGFVGHLLSFPRQRLTVSKSWGLRRP